MYRINATIIMLACCFACTTAAAGISSEMTVSGIVTSPACTPSLGDGGVVNYGVISSVGLQPGTHTKLEKREINFSIACTSALRMAIKFTDNRAASRVPGITGTATDPYNYGLGKVGDKNIGGYSMALSGVATADGVAVENIYSWSSGAQWDGGAKYLQHEDHIFSFGSRYGGPIRFKRLNAKINVEATLSRPEELPLAQAVSLDGSATFEGIYL